MSKAHAKFAPSKAERWVACPGSVKLSEGYPDKQTPAALSGSKTHSCLERILKNGLGKIEATKRFLLKSYDPDTVKRAVDAALHIFMRVGKHEVLESESTVKMDFIHPDFWGTLDAAVIEHFGMLQIIDFKDGKGVVEVEENPQLISYAIGKAHEHHYNFDRIRLSIIQPNAYHRDGTIRNWDCPPSTLHEWTKRFREAVKEALGKNARLRAGVHCYYCPAKNECPAFTPEAIAPIKAQFMRPRSEEERQARLKEWFG